MALIDSSQTDLETLWVAFASVTIPKHAPPIQREAMRQAFFAGLSTIAQLILVAQRDYPSNLAGILQNYIAQIDTALKSGSV